MTTVSVSTIAALAPQVERKSLRAGQTENKSLWNTLQDWRKANDFAWPELTAEEVDGWRDRSAPRALV